MPDSKNIADVRALLKEGKVQEADDLLTRLEAADAEKSGAAAAKPVEPPPPRAPNLVLMELLSELVAHLGNKPAHEVLLEELKAVLAPPKKV